jgi:hypothetical protein
MFKAVIKVFIVAIACAVAANNTTGTDCKQSNDFVKTKCGAKKPYKCCTSTEACVGPVKYKTGDDQYLCSKDRKLSGPKLMKVVFIPVVFLLLDICIVAYMVLKMLKENHGEQKVIALLCIGLIVFSWPLLFSEKWVFGCWTAFFALFVAYLNNFEGLANWIKKAAWVMQVFQVILLLGPNEEFFVPLYGQSKASNSQLIVSALGVTEATCDTFYDNFFKITSVEKGALNADPDKAFSGFCVEGWLSFVQVMVMFQGFLSMVMVFVTAPRFLGSVKDGASGALTSVLPSLASLDKHHGA